MLEQEPLPEVPPRPSLWPLPGLSLTVPATLNDPDLIFPEVPPRPSLRPLPGLSLTLPATYSSPSTDGFFLLGFHWLAWECLRARRGYTHYEIAYWAERRGRARVEQEMRKLTDVQLNTEQGFFVQPIAQIESCFRQCVGTPRQGLLVPASRSVLKLTNNMSPEALDGLEEFSHVWLTFKFHLNTNTLKEAKAFAGAVENSQARMFGTVTSAR